MLISFFEFFKGECKIWTHRLCNIICYGDILKYFIKSNEYISKMLAHVNYGKLQFCFLGQFFFSPMHSIFFMHHKHLLKSHYSENEGNFWSYKSLTIFYNSHLQPRRQTWDLSGVKITFEVSKPLLPWKHETQHCSTIEECWKLTKGRANINKTWNNHLLQLLC